VSAGSSPITDPRLRQKRTRSQGPSLGRHYPGFSGTMTLSDSRAGRRLTAPFEAATPANAGLPQLPGSPFQHAVPTTQMDQNGCVCRLLPRPTRAFPDLQAGRRPSLHFRGLLRLHSRYGLLNRSTAQGGLYHEASARPVAQPNRSLATRSYRQLPGWIPPPLVNRAVGAHCK
jgi:hypothetical protein